MDKVSQCSADGQLRTPRGAPWVIASLEVPEERGLGVPSAALMSKPLRHEDASELKAIEKQQTGEDLLALPPLPRSRM